MIAVLAARTRGAGLGSAGLLRPPASPSLGTSDDADSIQVSLREIAKRQRPPGLIFNPATSRAQRAAKRIVERLYDALVEAKVMTAQVAMHLDRGWRDRLFAQLDRLLDVEEWHEDDEPMEGKSFATFLRMILYQKPERRPGLGLSHRGNLIAAWTAGKDRLTLEFLPDDVARWVLSCEVDGELERAAGATHLERLPVVLEPYCPARWFGNGEATR